MEDLYQRASLAKTELRKDIFESFVLNKDDVLKYARETYTTLRSSVIKEVQAKNEVSVKTEDLLNDVTDIISLCASEVGVAAITKARRIVMDAIFPDYPYDTPLLQNILPAFKKYRAALEFAIGQHFVSWEKWKGKITEASYQEYVPRLKDLRRYMDNKNTSNNVEPVD